MRCAANVTLEKWGMAGDGPGPGGTSKQSRSQRDDRVFTRCCPGPGAAAAQVPHHSEFPAVILWMPSMDWSIQLLLL